MGQSLEFERLWITIDYLSFATQVSNGLVTVGQMYSSFSLAICVLDLNCKCYYLVFVGKQNCYR